MFLSQITEEETRHRRQLTEFAVELTLLAAAVGLALELFFCFIVLSPDQRILDRGLYLLMSVTTVVLGFLAIMLGMNRLKKIPHWVVSSLFLLALIFLIICSDTLQQLLNSPATMFFLVPWGARSKQACTTSVVRSKTTSQLNTQRVSRSTMVRT